MRKILFLLALLVSFGACAQVISEPNRLFPKNNFSPPKDTAFAAIRAGEIRYHGASSMYYWWNGTLWKALTDTAVLSTKANVQKVVNDSSAVLRALASTPDGVTSVGTNTGSGITGGTITSSGTIAADTAVLSTKLWAEKAVDDTAKVLRTLATSTYPPVNLLLPATGSSFINHTPHSQTWVWNPVSNLGMGFYGYSPQQNDSKTLQVNMSGTNLDSNYTTYGLYSITQTSTTGQSSKNIGAYYQANNAPYTYGIYTEALGGGGAGNKESYGGYFSGANHLTNYGGYFTTRSLGGINYAIRTGLGSIKFDTLISSGARFVKHNALGVLYGSDTLVASGAPLSGLTAATAANTIDNGNHAQTWDWNSLTATGLRVASSSTVAAANSSTYAFNSAMSGVNANANVTAGAINATVSRSGTTSQNVAVSATAQSGESSNTGVSSSAVGNNSSTKYSFYGTSTGNAGDKYGSYLGVSGTGGTSYGQYSTVTTAGTTNYGAYFNASGATNNTGVYTSGTDYGVRALASANFGNAVSGDGTAGTFGTGVYGIGNSAGVIGVTNASNGQGVVGRHDGTTGQGYAFFGVTSGAKTTGYAAYFQAAGATNNYALVTDGGNVGFGTTTPSTKAIVEMSSTTQGFLPPRMTKTQRDAISSPATGLTIYQTDNTPGVRVYNGTNWMRFTETAD